MTYRYTENDVRSALIGLCRAAGAPVAGGVGSYQLRAIDSTGAQALFVQINEHGGVRRLIPGYTAKTKRELCMMVQAYRQGFEAARA
jgi:hypothetical protein